MKIGYLFLTALGVAAGLLADGAGPAKKGSGDRDAELRAAGADPALVRKGRETYVALCQACHGEEKAKNTLSDAPSNLFDSKWYHGGQPAQIEKNILNGLLEKGMPPWKDALPAEDTTAVTAFLLSFQKGPSTAPAQTVPAPK